MICPDCGCDLEIEKEMFSRDPLFTAHSCKGDSDRQMILKALSALRKHGLPCFLATELLTPELEKQIKGEG